MSRGHADAMAPRPQVGEVWALDVRDDLDAVNVHLAALEEAGLLGLSRTGGVTTVWLTQRRDDLPLSGTWRRVPTSGWDARWRASVQPVEVAGFTVTPPWHATGAPSEIVIEPAQAFGTGHHETTTGCVRALAGLDLHGRTVLDVGTGTGLLAIVAHRCGAARVVGCDVDPVAVAAARGTVAAAGAAVEVVHGSLDAVGGGTFDVVVANLDTATIVALADRLVASARERLVVSGVSNERADEAVAALQAAGLDRIEQRPGREWTVLVGVPTRGTGRVAAARVGAVGADEADRR